MDAGHDDSAPPDLRVECYAGHRGQVRPTRVRLGGLAYAVDEVLDAWIGPDHRYFRLRFDGESVVLVRHDLEQDRWDLVLLEQPLG